MNMAWANNAATKRRQPTTQAQTQPPVLFPDGGRHDRGVLDTAFKNYSNAQRIGCWSRVRKAIPPAELQEIQNWACIAARWPAMSLDDESFYWPFCLLTHAALTRGFGCEPEQIVQEIEHNGSARGILLS